MFWRMTNEERLSSAYSDIKEKYERLKVFNSISVVDLQKQVAVLRLLNQNLELKVASQKKIIHDLQIKYNKLRNERTNK